MANMTVPGFRPGTVIFAGPREGNEEAAKQVFAGLEWQYPETLYEESKGDFATTAPQVEQGDFAVALDECFDEFLKTEGWRNLDGPSMVC